MYHEEKSPYRFIRRNSFYTDTLSRDGMGALVKSGTGLIWSGFRPSDDACTYGYLIPSNMFAVVILEYIHEISKIIPSMEEIGQKAMKMADTVRTAIETYGVTKVEGIGDTYAYEVDGFGQFHLMDDANVPSLLGLPFLGCVPLDDPIYQNTRRFVWSKANPYFFKGSAGEGIGGPHIGIDYIWPMSLVMLAHTSTDEKEIRYCIETIRDTDANTGFIHESFNKDNPDDYTRPWMAWANTLFGELIIKLQEDGRLKDLI